MNKINFDAKHLIRWGIPGWYFLISISFFFPIAYPSEVYEFAKQEGLNLVGLAAAIIGLGILLGNIITYLSMFIFFNIPVKTNQYIRKEFRIDEVIMYHSKGEEVQRLYSYRLGNLHAKRNMLTSSIFAFLLFLYICIYNKIFNGWFVGAISVKLTMIIIFYYTYRYYKRNLSYFEDEVMELHKVIEKTEIKSI